MKQAIIELLRCPFCGGRFAAEAQAWNADKIVTGILHCRCRDNPPLSDGYPIVGGIAIVKPNMSPILEALRSRKPREAFRRALSVEPRAPSDFWGRCIQRLAALPRWSGAAFRRRLQARRMRWQESIVETLEDGENGLTVHKALSLLFLEGNSWVENFNYLFYRYSQPRHLEALSFSRCLSEEDVPILDLACGMGHMTWHLSRQRGASNVLGLDDQFVLLCLAQFMSPHASFICSSVDSRLPIAEGVLGAVYCSDAFFYFPHRALVVDEIKRVLKPKGVALLIGLRNRLVSHVDPTPRSYRLSPGEYSDLMGNWPHTLVPDSVVLHRYLSRLGPDCARMSTATDLEHEPKISIVASEREDVFRAYGRFAEWPHATGRLRVNPLYAMTSAGGNNDAATLLRTYPSDFYEEENAESRTYLPANVEVSRATIQQLEAGNRTPEVDALVDRLVVLGLPDRYL